MSGAIQAVVFDMDGTITAPLLDFPKIKAEIGSPSDLPLLEAIAVMPDPERARAEGILLRHELAAARDSTLNPGVREALAAVAAMGLKTAVVTRNCLDSVDIVFAKHGLRFDAVLTRENSLPKPDPDGVLIAAWRLSVPPSACVMVGDYEFDIQAGGAAGAVTVLYAPVPRQFTTVPDFEIRSMAELPALLKALLGPRVL